MHDNRIDEESANEKLIEDIPEVSQIERKFNERVSAQSIYDLHDRVEIIESRKLKGLEIERRLV